jgi:CRP-like cAMP-binding protein
MILYDKLLQFPLFQGMSHADLMEVVGHTKFEFYKRPEGQRIIKEGDPCDHLIFMTSGSLFVETVSDDHSCRVTETLNAPYTIQAGQLFGLSQRYTSTFRTLSDCNFIAIDKQEILLLLETQLVFRINMLNLLAADAQRLHRRFWRSAPLSLRDRITRFFFSRCLYPAGPKTFYILMKHIAAELNDSRLDISIELNGMQKDGLLTLHRGRIEIPIIERLLM